MLIIWEKKKTLQDGSMPHKLVWERVKNVIKNVITSTKKKISREKTWVICWQNGYYPN